MSRRWETRAVWTVAIVAFVAAMLEWSNAGHVDARERAAQTIHDLPAYTVISDDSIETAAAIVGDHDVFRLTRQPSNVAYQPDEENAPPPPPAPPKPVVSLSGIVGPPWAAVLEGVPGHQGSVVAKPGDTISRAPSALLIVRRVRRDTVVVAGADTTWRLTLYRSRP